MFELAVANEFEVRAVVAEWQTRMVEVHPPRVRWFVLSTVSFLDEQAIRESRPVRNQFWRLEPEKLAFYQLNYPARPIRFKYRRIIGFAATENLASPDLLLDFKVDSKQTPVPRIAIVRIQYPAAGIAIVHSKTKRTESVQPKLENGDLRLRRFLGFAMRLDLLVPEGIRSIHL